MPLLDNQHEDKKVSSWLEQYTESGHIDIVTGYFTVGALAFLAQITQKPNLIHEFRMIIGDIVHKNTYEFDALDLLNENLSVEAVLSLPYLAQKAKHFLLQNNVLLKTLEPNFCHAKLYLQKVKKDPRLSYYISGSSNLTEAGIGRKQTHNVELNIAETGENERFTQLSKWFEELWKKPQAHDQKTIITEKGKQKKMPFKDYLIEQIERLFKPYTPQDIYHKILFELFYQEEDPKIEQELNRLQTSVIFQKLYDFQQIAVQNLIKMLLQYNGALLADAVGLGKTWTTLAVMKYFQTKGHEIIVLCPKKLKHNWQQHHYKQNTLFVDDRLDFETLSHSDLREGGLKNQYAHADFFTNDRPKLIVIDESHNLRNDKSMRYKFLMEQMLRKNKGEVKVLLLSATPINTGFIDVRNQFAIIAKGDDNAFANTHDINSLSYIFRKIQQNYNNWTKKEGNDLTDFYSEIQDSPFLKLTDTLIVARTRKQIKNNFNANLSFPKHKPPINIFKTPEKFGIIENFDELMDSIQLGLWVYQPSKYTDNRPIPKNTLQDNEQREMFLVGMMKVLLLKRLESSWFAFYQTITKIEQYHQNILARIQQFLQHNDNDDTPIFDPLSEDEDFIEEQANEYGGDFWIGKRNPMHLANIKNNIANFKADIKKDLKTLIIIKKELEDFNQNINSETQNKSKDTKLQELLKIIQQKQTQPNKKILIFSAYSDTVQYLFNELKKRGTNRIAMTTSQKNQNSEDAENRLEPILQRFAPYTKLFKEKKWNELQPQKTDETPQQQYQQWIQWIAQTPEHQNIHQLIQNPIDILISNDILSEGQNLQDADMIINYDIHWNPVRVIQRIGRIDRIGSPNETIQCINFWPSKNINDYIKLKERVEQRMNIMKLTNAEINPLTEDNTPKNHNEQLEERQNANLLQQMQTSLEELDGEKTIGFDDLTFDIFRQQLKKTVDQSKENLKKLPNGIFSGFQIPHNSNLQPGIIALIKNTAATPPNDKAFLIYIDHNAQTITENQKNILEILEKYQTQNRTIPPTIDAADPQHIQQLKNTLTKWVQLQCQTTNPTDDPQQNSYTAGAAMLKALRQLQNNNKIDAFNQQEAKPQHYQLIAWLLIS